MDDSAEHSGVALEQPVRTEPVPAPEEVFKPSLQFADRGVIMPPSDDYYMVGRDKLKRLNEERAGWVTQGLTLALGVAVPCLINAQAANNEGQATTDAFYWNSMGAAGGFVAVAVLLVIALSRRNRFASTMEEIESGKPFRVTDKGLIEVSPKPPAVKPSPLFEFLSRLWRRDTGSEKPQ